MDRRRLVSQIKSKGIIAGSKTLKIVRELGSGGNGVAFLCQPEGTEAIVAKVYIPPDSRDLDERAFKRFKNEISLVSKMRHPNVIKALDSGTIQIGAYNLPFYTMPFAPSTLRQEISKISGTDILERKLRIFLRASLGVAALHSHGIVHRDVKPENILISKEGTPWVADLGIARVSAQLATTGVKTIASERLRNQDYYAPEQRFGKATEVDYRADIYALGCILYELLSGTPPVRINAPKLQSLSDAFAPLDPIVDRMTAYKPSDRYSNLEDVIEELSVNIGWILSAHETGRRPVKTDLPAMVKLLKSSNDSQRTRGIEIARRLGQPAVDTLHDLLGHGRRDVRNSAALALGEIADPSSLPYLISALYGNAASASKFRPSADTASQAIENYPTQRRLESIAYISQPIRPYQVAQILGGTPSAESYPLIQSLFDKKLILKDYSENEVELFADIDEERIWPEIKRRLEGGAFRSAFEVRNLLKHLSSAHRSEFMSLWLNQGITDSWYFNYVLEMVLEIETDKATRRAFLEQLDIQAKDYRGVFKESESFIRKVNLAIRSLSRNTDDPTEVA
ncbi:MAG TPA: protein kinase [Pyrinomonadaceae bacterium]|nr:protein kinase [Pyrinomonadaceae bacterium]